MRAARAGYSRLALLRNPWRYFNDVGRSAMRWSRKCANTFAVEVLGQGIFHLHMRRELYSMPIATPVRSASQQNSMELTGNWKQRCCFQVIRPILSLMRRLKLAAQRMLLHLLLWNPTQGESSRIDRCMKGSRLFARHVFFCE